MERPTPDALMVLPITAQQECIARWVIAEIVAAYGGTLRYPTGYGVGFWRTDGTLSDALTGGPDIDAEITRRINPLRDDYTAVTGRVFPWNIKAHNAVLAALKQDRRVAHKGGRREVEAYFDIAKR